MTGSYDSLLRLLDKVDTMQFIRVTDLGYAIDLGYATDLQEESSIDDANITLAFELTFINP